MTAGTCAHYEETSPCPSLPLCSTKPTAIDTTTEPTSVRTTEPTTTKAATSTTMVKNPTTSMIRPSTPAASISTTSKKPTTDQSTDSQATTVKVATKDQTTNDQASVVQGTTGDFKIDIFFFILKRLDSPMVDTTEIVGTNSSTFQLTDNDNVFSSSGQDLLVILVLEKLNFSSFASSSIFTFSFRFLLFLFYSLRSLFTVWLVEARNPTTPTWN